MASLPSRSGLSSVGQASISSMLALYLANPRYGGPVFTLRRSSDGATADFFADAEGNLGMAAGATGTSLLSWLGSDGRAYVSVWYDQSGRGNNATQSRSASQPVLDVGAQYVDFAGNKYMNMVGSPFSPGNALYSYVVKHVGGGGGLLGICDRQTQYAYEMLNLIVYDHGYNEYWAHDGWSQNDFYFRPYAAGNVVSMTYDQFNRMAYVNNALVAVVGSSNHNLKTSSAQLGMDCGGDAYFNGRLYSVVTSVGVVSAPDRSLLEGCSMCPAGTYQPLSSGSLCVPCPAGQLHLE